MLLRWTLGPISILRGCHYPTQRADSHMTWLHIQELFSSCNCTGEILSEPKKMSFSHCSFGFSAEQNDDKCFSRITKRVTLIFPLRELHFSTTQAVKMKSWDSSLNCAYNKDSHSIKMIRKQSQRKMNFRE